MLQEDHPFQVTVNSPPPPPSQSRVVVLLIPFQAPQPVGKNARVPTNVALALPSSAPPPPVARPIDDRVGPNRAVVDLEHPDGDGEEWAGLDAVEGQVDYDGDDEGVEVGPRRVGGREHINKPVTTCAPALGNTTEQRQLDLSTSESSSSEDDTNMSTALPFAPVKLLPGNGTGKRQRDECTSSTSEDENDNIGVLPPPKRHAAKSGIGTVSLFVRVFQSLLNSCDHRCYLDLE